MKKNSKNKKFFTVGILLIVSLIINALLISLFFIKFSPYIQELEGKAVKLAKLENNLDKAGCEKRAWSVSAGKFICLDSEIKSKSEALSSCSKKFNEALVEEDFLKNFKTVEQLDDSRDFVIKMCMESYGYQY